MGWLAARLTHDTDHDAWSAGMSGPLNRLNPLGAGRRRSANALQPGYLAVITFPGFGEFRQSAGEQEADAAIVEACARMMESGDALCIARTGVDTIDCLLFAPSDDEALRHVRNALDQLREPAAGSSAVSLREARAAIHPLRGQPPSQADFAATAQCLFSEKAQEKRVFVVDTFDQCSETMSAVTISHSLRKALLTEAVSLVYQPKLDVRAGAFNTAEALFRWNTEEGRLLSVSELIVNAERHGAITDLTLWTLRRAVSDQLTLMDNGIDLATFVNLSGHLISDSEFTLQAIEIIKSVPGKIGLEITETSVIEHSDRALANLEMYSAAGAEIAIDDYGTGLSSLRYLKRIPAQELKIDREFIKDLTNSHRDPMIVRSTIDLAHALGLRVTAEGVDDATKMALLKVMGCDQLQGFHIAKPMPLTELVSFMQDTERKDSLLNPTLSLLPAQVKSGGG